MSIGGQSDTNAERKVYRLTPEGFARKKERLDYLRNVKRKGDSGVRAPACPC